MSARLDFDERCGGIIECRDLRFIAEGFSWEDVEADLTVKATDRDGQVVERRLRLVLTQASLPALP